MSVQGISDEHALQLLKEHGYNQIQKQSSVRPLKIFFAQLTSPLIFILIIAAIISLILHEATDAFFILIVVIINTFLGFSQEYKAENTLEKLKQSVSKTARVIRNGKIKTIDTKYLVPGDVFIIEPGLRIPADGEVLEANEILINESVLTGESEPVEKDSSEKKSSSVYMGTLVISGIGKAIITTTGSKTKFGEIAKSLSEDLNPPTPIKNELSQLSKILTIGISAIVVLVFILGIIVGTDLKEIFFTSVALGVSTIPEGLIISLTVTLALGMNRLLTKRALVKNLPAAETLGDVEILCIDKTGTLTYGNMKVSDSDFVDKEIAFKALAISNNESNFIDKAVLEYLGTASHQGFVEKAQKTRKKLFPFSSLNKYTGAWDGEYLYAVGAPEVIFNFSKDELTEWKKKYTQKGSEGNRMLGIAYKKLTSTTVDRKDFSNMQFLGLLYIQDPVRESVQQSLSNIEHAGIDVKVITGDLKETAVSVLSKLGIRLSSNEMLSGKELSEIIDDGRLEKMANQIKLFYRTTPDQKLAIVRALQSKNKIVGMMGDGVNDSPALKAAEIGIVVDNATDVSKEVADIILLDSDFATIEEAVAEGRNIIKNLRKILTFLLTDSLTETVLILLALIFIIPLPLTPALLLWINIIEDGLPSLALAFEKSSKAQLLQKPKSKRKSLLDKKVVSLILITSLIKDIIFFVVYFNMITGGTPLEQAQTFIFAGISLSSLMYLFSAKTIETNLWKEPVFNNKMVNFSFVLGVLLLVASIYFVPISNILGTTPLSVSQLWLLLGLSVISTAFVETAKAVLHAMKIN